MLLGSWIACLIARHKKAVVYSTSWTLDHLSSYREPVPDFAIERALQVKEALPGATFYVEHLRETVRGIATESKPTPDPFLILAVGHLKLYLDVWDEPKFEGRRVR